MANWVKVLLGIVLSLAIFGGVAAAVYDAHPMRPNYNAAEERCADDTPGLDESRIDCWNDYQRMMDRSERSDTWVAVGSGAVAVMLFWFLVNLLYLRPRRRRSEGETGAA